MVGERRVTVSQGHRTQPSTRAAAARGHHPTTVRPSASIRSAWRGRPARGARHPRGGSLLGQVSQITPWKAQDTRSALWRGCGRPGTLRSHWCSWANRLFRPGREPTTNEVYLRQLTRWVAELGVRSSVIALASATDVPGLFAGDRPLAVALLGRSVRQRDSREHGRARRCCERRGWGARAGEDGVSGRLLAPRRPDVWATAVSELLNDPPPRSRVMGGARRESRANSARRPFSCHATVYELVLQQGEQDPLGLRRLCTSARRGPFPWVASCAPRHAPSGAVASTLTSVAALHRRGGVAS